MSSANEERPWGTFSVLGEETNFKVKKIVVRPSSRLSYQRHEFRSEHWFVLEGHGAVTLDGTPRMVGPGESVEVAVGEAHRIENTSNVDLVFIEVQHGRSFAEDDIVRLDDDYGRSPS